MNLVETLKHNERCFSLLSKEEQECFEEVGPENCQKRYDVWFDCGQEKGHFGSSITYRIKPNYRSEPQVEKCEVKPYGVGQLGYCRSDDSRWRYLHEALSDPDFMYYEYEDEEGGFTKSVYPRWRMIYDKDTAPIPKYVLFVKRPI